MLTAAGHITLYRVYFVCRRCQQGIHALDARLGVTAQAWLDRCREKLLAGGWLEIVREIAATRKTLSKASHQESLTKLSTYLEHNSERLEYARRLAQGRSIGSGQVEGACKHMIGRRLKQTGARWRIRRVNRMAALCALADSDQWDAYWAAN